MSVKNINPYAGPNPVIGSAGGQKTEKTQAASRTAVDSAFSHKLNEASRKTNVDTIELSARPSGDFPAMASVRDKIVSELKEDKDPQYLDELRARLSVQEYPLDAQALADSLLDIRA